MKKIIFSFLFLFQGLLIIAQTKPIYSNLKVYGTVESVDSLKADVGVLYPDGSFQTTASSFSDTLTWLDPVTSFIPFYTCVADSINKSYIASVTGSGWTENYIYTCDGNSWVETIPVNGDAVIVIDSAKIFTYNGGNWISQSASTAASIYWVKDGVRLFNANAGNVTIYGYSPFAHYLNAMDVTGRLYVSNGIQVDGLSELATVQISDTLKVANIKGIGGNDNTSMQLTGDVMILDTLFVEQMKFNSTSGAGLFMYDTGISLSTDNWQGSSSGLDIDEKSINMYSSFRNTENTRWITNYFPKTTSAGKVYIEMGKLKNNLGWGVQTSFDSISTVTKVQGVSSLRNYTIQEQDTAKINSTVTGVLNSTTVIQDTTDVTITAEQTLITANDEYQSITVVGNANGRVGNIKLFNSGNTDVYYTNVDIDTAKITSTVTGVNNSTTVIQDTASATITAKAIYQNASDMMKLTAINEVSIESNDGYQVMGIGNYQLTLNSFGYLTEKTEFSLDTNKITSTVTGVLNSTTVTQDTSNITSTVNSTIGTTIVQSNDYIALYAGSPDDANFVRSISNTEIADNLFFGRTMTTLNLSRTYIDTYIGSPYNYSKYHQDTVKIESTAAGVLNSTTITQDTLGFKYTQRTGALTDNAPTAAEINGIIGVTAVQAGAGFVMTIKDTTGTALLYRFESDGTDWFYVVTTKAL